MRSGPSGIPWSNASFIRSKSIILRIELRIREKALLPFLHVLMSPSVSQSNAMGAPRTGLKIQEPMHPSEAQPHPSPVASPSFGSDLEFILHLPPRSARMIGLKSCDGVGLLAEALSSVTETLRALTVATWGGSGYAEMAGYGHGGDVTDATVQH